MRRPGDPSAFDPIHSGAIDLRGLMLALRVARNGSIRLAARESGLTASAVSRRLLAMEDSLGVSLFERRTSGVKPTAAGERFLADATRILNEVKAALCRAREAGSASIGQVAIGTYFSASTGHLRDALVRFLQQHRRVQVWFREGVRRDLLTAVRQGEIDVAILLGPDSESDLDQLPLWREASMVALPETHRLSDAFLVQWQDLVGETFVVTSRGSGPEVRAIIDSYLRPAHPAQFAVHDVSREAMFNLVGAGLGVAVLAESASGASYPGVVFRPVGEEARPTMVDASAYWDARRDNPVLRRFLSLFRRRQAAGARDGGVG